MSFLRLHCYWLLYDERRCDIVLGREAVRGLEEKKPLLADLVETDFERTPGAEDLMLYKSQKIWNNSYTLCRSVICHCN